MRLGHSIVLGKQAVKKGGMCMPNYLVFNYTAENLKAQTFGSTADGTVTSLLVDNDGALQIGGTVTAAIADTVPVTGEVSVTANDFDIRGLSAATDTVSVEGTVTAAIADTVPVTGEVTVTANDFDIRGLSAATDTVSVEGTVTAAIADTVPVTGEVSVTANDFDIRGLSAATDTVSVQGTVTAAIAGTVPVNITSTVPINIAGHGFTTSNLTITLGAGNLTNTAFNFNTSQMRQYSFYIRNTGTSTISASIQVSPTTTEAYYTSGTTASATLSQGRAIALVPAYFMNYTRLQVTSSQTATAVVYFNGQI